ncbi:MAG: thiamine-phosphate kinase [Lautropia sp.]
MGEFELIRRHFARGITPGALPPGAPRLAPQVALGIGDDCALLRPPPGQALAISTDLLLEGRHFFAGTAADAIGHKALAVNLSDLAAIGARPLGFTLALALPAIDEGWVAAFCRGLFALADRSGCPLVGGDTTRGPLTISITVFGAVAEAAALRRDAARPGDRIWVSGPLGGAALAVAQRRAGGAVDAAAARRLDWPEPRLALGAALAGTTLAGAAPAGAAPAGAASAGAARTVVAHAAIDLSDGLAGDLRHIVAASSAACGQPLVATLEAAAVPLDPALAGLTAADALHLALHGGDDYELLFTAPPRADAALRQLAPAAVAIGRIDAAPAGVAERGMLLLDRAGRIETIEQGGFDHFREESAGAAAPAVRTGSGSTGPGSIFDRNQSSTS